MNRKGIFRILLAVAIIAVIGSTAVQMAAAVGPSNQKVEYEQGTNERVYPTLTYPNPGECGTNDPIISDMILQYNTYWGPRVDPDNVRWSSDLWWLRYWVSYWYPSGLSANGLSTTTTRVCIGAAGQIWAPDDLRLIYLWHK